MVKINLYPTRKGEQKERNKKKDKTILLQTNKKKYKQRENISHT